MGLPNSEADNSLLVYMGATVLYGGTILYAAKKSRIEKPTPFVWGLILLFALGTLCFTMLRSYLGLTLFSVVCLIYCVSTSLQTMLPVDRKAVLITGTDSGIGHQLAKYLDQLGFTVFASVLDLNGPGAENLRKTCSERLSLLKLDITKSEQIKDMFLAVQKKLKHADLWGLINNAGILGFVGDGELLSMHSYKQCMDVNFFGPVELSKTFLPLLRTSKGRLINISSMAGGVPMPGMAAYGASKAALSMFSGVLRQELSKWGIRVSVIQPSAFKTAIQGTPALWMREEQILLENLTPDVKKDYGEDYILALKTTLPFIHSVSSSDFSPMQRDVLHALLAKYPRALYTPGKNAYKCIFLFSYFPVWFYDFCMSKLLKFPVVPSTLQTAE
ncbi:17-beta-hydroxysteroid dehydrogenase type 2 [Varanus komodoensis]|nr:17-beta-hydroxysteroid dehydrogenase type 2 [Varanus komodoensis]